MAGFLVVEALALVAELLGLLGSASGEALVAVLLAEVQGQAEMTTRNETVALPVGVYIWFQGEGRARGDGTCNSKTAQDFATRVELHWSIFPLAAWLSLSEPPKREPPEYTMMLLE